MESREIVKRCITFNNPPRIGLHFDVEPLNGKKWPVTDFGILSYPYDPKRKYTNPNNDWGMALTSLNAERQDKGQVKEHPLKDWNDFHNYPWPDFSNPYRYLQLKDEMAEFREKGLYVYGSVPSLIQLCSDLRYIENWFLDHLIHPTKLTALLEIIHKARMDIVDEYYKMGVDGVITWDDMGTNIDTLISPVEFRQIYFPWYKKFNDELHNRKMHFIHHCCGKVNKFMDMFIEAGTDVMQLDQPTLMGIDFLSENYGGKICFWNPVDIQTTMQQDNLDKIRTEAHEMVRKLGKFNGGFMVKAYESPEAINLTEEKFIAQYEAFLEVAEYK
jgi:hypothetical protein